MTLRSRLAAGLVTITIILVGPLLYAIQSLNGLHSDTVKLRDRDFAASLLLGRLRDGLAELRRQELALLFAKNEASRDAMARQIVQVAALADSLKQFDLPLYARDVSASVRQIDDAAPNEYRAALAGQDKFADSISEHIFVPALGRADSTVQRAERVLGNRTSQGVSDQETSIVHLSQASIIALIVALSTAALIAYWLTWSISKPIDELKQGMRAVADGELSYSVAISPNRSDELGELAESFREMTLQLAELDQLKAEFVSVASHELKTPINVIIGYLQLLEEGVYGALPQKQLDVHKTLVVQANTLLRLVKQLLDVSRFEAGGGRIEPRSIRLVELQTELENAFHVLAVQREIDFRVRCCEGMPEEVYWDLDRINEVLGNLISNAFKFTPHGGTVELIMEPTPDGVRMKVHDTGAGIPPDQLPRIFDKFYQADNQASARTVGTGLGLAIAKQIVDAHGGTISCESSQGVGTTFTLTLPRRVTRRPTLQHRAVPAPA